MPGKKPKERQRYMLRINDTCEMEVIKLQSILSQFSIYDGTQQLIETLTNRLQQLINKN